MSARRFPDRPLVGVGAVLLTPDLERVLLVERASPPAVGAWSLPGGLVEVGESLREACRREVAEETGLEIEPRDLCAVVERVIREPAGDRVEYHYVIVDFWTVVEELPVHASTDAAAARWVPVDGLDGLPHTRGLPQAVRRACQLARGEPSALLLEGEP